MTRLGRFAALLVGAALQGGCGSPSVQQAGAVALHDLHQLGPLPERPTLLADFYALPFPNDLRVDVDGTIDLSLMPRRQGLTGDYVEVIDREARGFGTNAGIFFRFSDDLDVASLPGTAAASLDPSSSVMLIDLTPGAPTFGQRHPVIVQARSEGGLFIGPHSLAVLPVPGLPLRQRSTYAAILTDRLLSSDGAPVRAAVDFESIFLPGASSSGDPQLARAAKGYAPLLRWLADHPEVRPVNFTLFTTGDFTSDMQRLRQAVYSQAPAPTLLDLTDDGEDLKDVDHIYSGTFDSPDFQLGDAPYLMSGGQFVYDVGGIPQVQKTKRLRVAMSLPVGTMPPEGWPVILYAHGTGGNYKSFIRDGSAKTAARVTDAAGQVIEQFAMVSIDQVLHGTRVPANTDVELAFFNLFNIPAARANVKQGALDDFQLLRLVKSVDTMTPDGKPLKFNPAKIYFKGHSQGGLTGPLFLSAEPEVKAAILSGAGGFLIEALLSKTEPIDIPAVVEQFLGEPVDVFHPLLSLAQTYLEDADPINYAPLLFRSPPPGLPPKSIFQSLGLIDNYAPVPTIEALALSTGVQPVRPTLQEIPNLDVAGLSWTDAPVQGNVAGGAATGVLLQYKQKGRADGHFVIFDIPAAVAQSDRFLATHSKSGLATLLPP